MLKRFMLFAVVVLLSTSTSYAQQTPGKFSISGFLSNPGYSRSDHSGSNFDGALGIGAEYWFTPRVSASLHVSTQTYTAGALTVIDPANGIVRYDTFSERAYPVDLLARYHFSGNQRWKPFVGGGLRLVSLPRSYFGPFEEFKGWNAVAEIDGGVTFKITPSLGLELELKHALQEQNITPVDNTRGSVGLSWRF